AELGFDRAHRARERFVGDGFGPIELSELPRHADCIHLLLANAKALHWKRVQDFVREHDAAKATRPRIEPLHTRYEIRRELRDALFLTLAQVGAHFENEIVARQRAKTLQLRQHIRRHHAGAGAQLQDVGLAELREHLIALPREAAAEKR